MGNLLLSHVLNDKQARETVAFALAPDERISACDPLLLFLDRQGVIRALYEAGAVTLARKLEEESPPADGA